MSPTLTLSGAARSAAESKGARSRRGARFDSGLRPPLSVSVLLCLALSCATPTRLWSAHDPARRASAVVLTDGKQQWLEDGERFDSIGSVVFSPDATRRAYAAQRGEAWFVVTDHQALGPYTGVAELQLTSTRLAFAAELHGGWAAVVDGVSSRSFEYIQGGTLHFSPNGEHVAFVGSDGRCAHIVVDSTEGPCRDRVLSMRVDDSGRAAAAVRDGRRERFLFQPGQAEPPADEVAEWKLSPDGKHFAYAARHGERWTAVIDGASHAECASIRHLRFGDSGRRLAWVCGEGTQASVVIDGEAGPKFPQLSAPLLSWSSPAYAYVAHDPQGAWVVAEDTMWGPYSEVSDLQLVGESGVAFVARAYGTTKVIHRERTMDVPPVVEGSLVASADGAHWAVIVGDPKTRTFWLAVDGTPVRRLSSDDVFSGAPLTPWLQRELAGVTR